MNTKQAINNYKEYTKITNMMKYAVGSIFFDDETGAPMKAYKERQEVTNYFQMEIFKRSTSEEFIKIVNDLYSKYDHLNEKWKRIAYLEKKSVDSQTKVPAEVMAKYQKTCSDAMYYWLQAKNKSDYEIYKPYLKNVIEAQRELGSYIKKENESIYEAFLSQFEEDITEKELDVFFATLKEKLVPLIEKVKNSSVKIDTSWAKRRIDHNTQLKLGNYLACLNGYDMSCGLVRETMHPFTTEISSHDVRVTTHIYENDFISNLFSMTHEGGHAIYMQQISKRFDGTCLKEGASMAFHESQSRFYENIVSRNESFVNYYFPKLQKIAKGKLDNISNNQFYLAINKVEPSLIRTEADELTYCLHIMIRYEIEKLMINNQVDFDTLNTLWNEKYKEYLGIDVPNDAKGILQDMHWTGGVGYFFSYALGNAYSAQIFNTMKKDLDFDALLASGNTKPIQKWLKENVHQYGALIKPKDLIKKITGEELNVNYYCDYLIEKYSKIYNLD